MVSQAVQTSYVRNFSSRMSISNDEYLAAFLRYRMVNRLSLGLLSNDIDMNNAVDVERQL